MKNKTCMICKTTIIIPGEQHVIVKHNDEKEIMLSKGYYHINCFREKLNGTSAIKELQSQALSFIKGAKKVAGIEEEQEIIV